MGGFGRPKVFKNVAPSEMKSIFGGNKCKSMLDARRTTMTSREHDRSEVPRANSHSVGTLEARFTIDSR